MCAQKKERREKKWDKDKWVSHNQTEKVVHAVLCNLEFFYRQWESLKDLSSEKHI